MALLDTISHLKDEVITALSSRLGADPDRTKTALSSALPALLGAAAKQAGSPGGTASTQTPPAAEQSPDAAQTAGATKQTPAATTPLADAVSNLQHGRATEESDNLIDNLPGNTANTWKTRLAITAAWMPPKRRAF